MTKPRRSHTGLKVILCLLMAVFIGLTAFMVKLCLEITERPLPPGLNSGAIQLPGREEAPPEETTQPETTLPEPERVLATATISAQGDLLMHKPIFNDTSAVKQADGSWDFSSIFTYLAPYLEGYDYSLANLETTFGGDDFIYQGWPLFNCPDPFADALKAAGYDMLLTGNNHSYDTKMTGILRSLEVTRAAGMETLGSRLSQEEKRYSVVEINGIPIGMVNYTFTTSMQGGKPMLNGNAPMEQPELINYFAYNKTQEFYAEVKQILADMEADGAKASVLYIHWGNEYEVEENGTQNQIAQELCNLGIDVIVGGHPHVVQPMELLQSATDPTHKTVCLYSMGNAVSNQRIEEMRLKTGHTEDGVLLSMTFEMYTDGEVYLADIDVLPTWVNMHTKNGGREYNIMPLREGEKDRWKELFGLTDAELKDCQLSFQRTMDLVEEGLADAKAWLAQQKEARDAEYLARVQG